MASDQWADFYGEAEYVVDALWKSSGREGHTALTFDVASDTETFQQDLELVRTFGEGFPVLLTDEAAIPISMFAHVRMCLEDARDLPDDRDEIGHAVATNARELFQTPGASSSHIAFVAPEEAQTSFLRRAREFIAQRFTGMSEGPGEGISSREITLRDPVIGHEMNVPGCDFKVSSDSEGLRALWSGAYFARGRSFGDALTSPVVSCLPAGTYVFGADGGHLSREWWDDKSLRRLPGPNSVHLMI